MSLSIMATLKCDRCKKVYEQRPLIPNAEGGLPETSPDRFEVIDRKDAGTPGENAVVHVSFADLCEKCRTTVDNLVARILLADEGADIAVNGGPTAAPKTRGPRAPKAAQEPPKVDPPKAESSGVDLFAEPPSGPAGAVEGPAAAPLASEVTGPASPVVSSEQLDPNQPF